MCTSTGTESSARAHIIYYIIRERIYGIYAFPGYLLLLFVHTYMHYIKLVVLFFYLFIIVIILYTGSTGRVANFYQPCHVFKHVFDMI